MKRLFIALLFFIGASAIAAPADTPDSRLMLVLDGSGSMWGQINGKAKIEIAREVIQDLLKDIKPGTYLGLTVYGHRRKGDCSDIQEVIPTGKVNASAFMAAVKNINPKGKTPMTAAVKQAAESLKYTEESATVVLVSDGEETCNLDPCAVATELEKAGIDFTVHVVGFDVSAKDKKAISQLECLSKNTGGEFFTASNARDLRKALTTAVKKAEAPIQGMLLNAKLTADGSDVDKGLGWDVYEIKADELGKRIRVTYSYNAKPLFRLAPGKYYVTVKSGSARAAKEVEIKADQLTKETLIFNAGRVKMNALLNEGAKPVDRGLGWDVYEVKADELGKRRKVTYSYDAQPLFVLPQGKYLITVRLGSASASKEIEIKADTLIKESIVLGAGKVRARVVLSAGGQAMSRDLGWDVYEASADELGKRKKVTYSYSAEPVFKLIAGKYLLQVKLGSAIARQEVEVKPNEMTDVTLDLKAGRIQMGARLADDKPAIEKGLGWDVYAAADELGKRNKVAYSYSRQPLFVLPEGKYRITVKNGAAMGFKDVDISAGKTAKDVITLNAGRVKIKAVSKAGGTALKVSGWDVYEASADKLGKRQRASYSYSAQPLFILNAGSYSFQVKAGKLKGNITLELKPGETRVTEVLVK